VPHAVRGMMMVEYPTECFREHVRRIHDSRKVNQNDCWISIYPVAVEIYMFVDKDQYTRKSELLLEHVIYSTSASVDVALSVRAEDLSRE